MVDSCPNVLGGCLLMMSPDKDVQLCFDVSQGGLMSKCPLDDVLFYLCLQLQSDSIDGWPQSESLFLFIVSHFG